MEIKKCSKCGAFIMSDKTLCDTCAKETAYANTVLKNYFEENVCFDSIPSISAVTGISPNVIQNYMKANDYIDAITKRDTFFTYIDYTRKDYLSVGITNDETINEALNDKQIQPVLKEYKKK